MTMEHVTKASVREAGLDKFYNAVATDGHAFVMDEPVSLGGTDQGPNPFALLASALGACTNMTLRMYADRKQLNLDEVDTEVTHTASKEGHQFERVITLYGQLTAAERARCLEIANKCPVHQLLVSGAQVSSRLNEDSP